MVVKGKRKPKREPKGKLKEPKGEPKGKLKEPKGKLKEPKGEPNGDLKGELKGLKFKFSFNNTNKLVVYVRLIYSILV